MMLLSGLCKNDAPETMLSMIFSFEILFLTTKIINSKSLKKICRPQCNLIHTCAEQEMEVRRCGAPPPPPPPLIIFEERNLPQQTIYHWKGNLSKSPIHFRYRQNILISRLYEQFSRNDSAKAPEKNFKPLKYEHIIYHFKANDLELLLI